MPIDYLVSPEFSVPIKSGKYRNRWQIIGEELYVNAGCMVAVDSSPVPLPSNAGTAYRMVQDEGEFGQFLRDWMSQSLVLYRGIAGHHYCWPDLLQGMLRSEGEVDYPDFTMSDSGRGMTRWLPAADLAIAQGVSGQCDEFTDALSYGGPVPVGFTVRIPVGSGKNLPLCWLNAGEIVVQGPLTTEQYRMNSITWLNRGMVEYSAWPASFTNLFLPPQRPYSPDQKQIDEWWNNCRTWMDAAAEHDPVARAAAARTAAERRGGAS